MQALCAYKNMLTNMTRGPHPEGNEPRMSYKADLRGRLDCLTDPYVLDGFSCLGAAQTAVLQAEVPAKEPAAVGPGAWCILQPSTLHLPW